MINIKRLKTLNIKLKRINIPNTVIEIKEYAFRKSENLENIVLPKKITRRQGT